jgi:fructose-bisphosphate aldolase, class I
MTNQVATTDRVQEILGWYRQAGRNGGVLRNLHWMLMTGRLAGTGFLNPYPVDQGIEHGPAKSFAPNPAGYDPRYHAAFAVKAGSSAYAAPPGFIQAVASEFAGQMPFILKVNSKEALAKEEPCPVVTASVRSAVELGCAAVGFTVYPGSGERNVMYSQLRELAEEAHANGLVVVVWAYPRGKHLSKDAETAIDIISYGVHLACELGADIVKAKPPKESIADDGAKKYYEGVKIGTLTDRVKHVVQCAFNGTRIVIFSGGAKKDDQDVFKEVKQIAEGGGFGSIMGRNAFQRPEAEAVKLIHGVQDAYLAQVK